MPANIFVMNGSQEWSIPDSQTEFVIRRLDQVAGGAQSISTFDITKIKEKLPLVDERIIYDVCRAYRELC